MLIFNCIRDPLEKFQSTVAKADVDEGRRVQVTLFAIEWLKFDDIRNPEWNVFPSDQEGIKFRRRFADFLTR